MYGSRWDEVGGAGKGKIVIRIYYIKQYIFKKQKSTLKLFLKNLRNI